MNMRRKNRRKFAAAFLAAPVCSLGHAQLLFEDTTVSSGVSFVHKTNYLMYPGLQDYMAAALAVGDFNRDGLPDLYWASGAGAVNEPKPDHLFMNNGDGTFTDSAESAGIAIMHAANGACVGDFDDDGWPDIYVTSFGNGSNNQGQVGKNVLWRNKGDGTFTNVAEQAGVHANAESIPNAYGCAFGDYDIDGDLDLMVAAWVDAADGNRLFRNNGDGTFTNVTGTAIQFPTTLWGFQPCFADMDGDGWPELLLAADINTSCYFRNNGDGTFTDVTVQSGTGLDQYGMGTTVGDFDNDGRLDWYVTSIYADPGQQPLGASGNKLYMNVGREGVHEYVEIAQSSGVDDGGWGWGAAAVDFDHDTWLDIVTVNGRPVDEWDNEPEYLFRSNAATGPGGEDLTFTEMAAVCGVATSVEAKAIAILDYDRDGGMDIAISNNGSTGGVTVPGAIGVLYHNDSAWLGTWLQVAFDTQANPRIAPEGFGARITAIVGDKTFVRFMDGGPTFMGTSELSVHFGLGEAKSIDELRIDWPRGYVTRVFDVAVNQHLNVIAPALCDFDGDGVVGGGDLGIMLAAWGPLETSAQRAPDVDNDGIVGGGDLGVLLASWD